MSHCLAGEPPLKHLIKKLIGELEMTVIESNLMFISTDKTDVKTFVSKGAGQQRIGYL